MVSAWYLNEDEASTDPRAECKTQKLVELDQLRELGLDYFQVNAEDYEQNEKYNALKEKRGYNYQDKLIVSPKTLPNYQEKIKCFYEEHLHKDEEIRFVLDGLGYFDVRDKDDVWIRIEVAKNDLLILPAGIYHRFTLDKNDYIEVIRLFQGEPVWTPYNRH